ncbi:MAG TPA: hypothetical protein VE620_03500 [Myxococcales bacterium]|nr:hypothetical protein [Myxococcales bacterium]
MKRPAAAALLIVAAACGESRPRGPMSEERRMYLSKCTACHGEYEPSRYTKEQWIAALDEMEKMKRVHLTPEERSLILAYLTGGR